MPALHIHSVDDPRALYAGGLGPPFPFTTRRVVHPSVDWTVATWVRRDGCDPAPVEKESRVSGGHSARLLVYPGCREGAEVWLWQLSGAGHGWPGAVTGRQGLVGPATRVIDANAEIWRFVSRFSLRPSPTSSERRLSRNASSAQGDRREPGRAVDGQSSDAD